MKRQKTIVLSLAVTVLAVLMLSLGGVFAGLFFSRQLAPAHEQSGMISDAGEPGRAMALAAFSENTDEPVKVHLGGHMAGFSLKINGVMILDFCEVETAAGKAKLQSDLRVGDVIEKIGADEIKSAADIKTALNSGDKKQNYKVAVLRCGERCTVSVAPLIERVTGEYRLGIMAKSDIAGIGTVTYTRQDGRFAALGHAIGGENISEIAGGTAYECKLVGLEKGARGRAGSVKGTINGQRPIGAIDKNIVYGVYGTFDEPRGELYEIARREEVRPGKAQIISSVNGERIPYDVEIVKTVYQTKEGEKGMVLKVTDKRLLDLTGGIVQGMSGSPIIQNGKLVGAVTHVFIKDPQRGYGVYLDWMIGQ